jgi:hypothetical protein
MRTWCDLLCLLLATGGCVTASVEKKNVNPFAGFTGQSVTGLVAKLGLPDDEKTFGGTEVYIWSTSHPEGKEYEVSQNQCTIKAAVDDNGIIRTVDWTGNFGGCRGYMDALAHKMDG